MQEKNMIEHRMHGKYDNFHNKKIKKKRKKKSHYINDTISAIKWWACFEDNGEKQDEFVNNKFEEFIEGEVKKDKELDKRLSQKHKKTGRNEPCPCGSGKKYKKCCYDLHRSGTSIIRLEEKYDLLKEYPKNSPEFKQLFEKEAIEIDMVAYKALHHRAIPTWVKRDHEQERIDNIKYLKAALDLFLDKCEREQITSLSDYDERYMVHYRAYEWISALIDMITEKDSKEIRDIKVQAIETLRRFKCLQSENT
jgi:hypothetical protein